MKRTVAIISGAVVFACVGMAKADDFQCFKAKDTAKAFVKTSATVSDTYAGSTATDFKKPFLLCDSASIASDPQTTPTARLSCFKVKGAKLAVATTKNVTITLERVLRASRRCSSFAPQRPHPDRSLSEPFVREGGVKRPRPSLLLQLFVPSGRLPALRLTQTSSVSAFSQSSAICIAVSPSSFLAVSRRRWPAALPRCWRSRHPPPASKRSSRRYGPC